MDDVISQFGNQVFINCSDTNSALGVREIECLYSYGKIRNKDIFLIKDYTDVNPTNLIHVLKNRNVLLLGDKLFCEMLYDYLVKIEEGNINARCTEVPNYALIYTDDTILCNVQVFTGLYEENEKQEYNKSYLEESGVVDYTNYFTSVKSFCLIEKYLNGDKKKYCNSFRPKGILLGKIPGASGNVFIDGVLDEHPKIIKINYSSFRNCLFQYCIRLARFKACNILQEFWNLIIHDRGLCQMRIDFPNMDLFVSSMKKLLKLKEFYTSQELFVIFNIAYYEMISGHSVDISDKIIYWEPHFIPREDFDYLVKWLESESVNGYTLCVGRDISVRVGSICKRKQEQGIDNYTSLGDTIFFEGKELENNVKYDTWNNIRMRFEDIKLSPKENLTKLCEQIGISWSETMLTTTRFGFEAGYRGSVGYDLKAVFNKYEEFLSEFDRFRVYIGCCSFQKRWGYPYEAISKYTRNELKKMFSKPFKFEDASNNKMYKVIMAEKIKWNLWKAIKRDILDDVSEMFLPVNARQSKDKYEEYVNRKREINLSKEYVILAEQEINKIVDYIKYNEKIIIYGTGENCDLIMQQLDENKKSSLLFCDKKAVNNAYSYMGKDVLHPSDLIKKYKDYKVLITSVVFYKQILQELIQLGVKASRIYCCSVWFGDFNS